MFVNFASIASQVKEFENQLFKILHLPHVKKATFVRFIEMKICGEVHIRNVAQAGLLLHNLGFSLALYPGQMSNVVQMNILFAHASNVGHSADMHVTCIITTYVFQIPMFLLYFNIPLK